MVCFQYWSVNIGRAILYLTVKSGCFIESPIILERTSFQHFFGWNTRIMVLLCRSPLQNVPPKKLIALLAFN